MINRSIVASLVGCVIAAAIGGFGAPLLCSNADAKCPDRWQQAAAGALTAAGTLGTLLARLGGDRQP
jgi:hypothetical protein